MRAEHYRAAYGEREERPPLCLRRIRRYRDGMRDDDLKLRDFEALLLAVLAGQPKTLEELAETLRPAADVVE